MNIGGDVAGRDVVKSTTVGDDYIAGNVTNVTNVGLAPKAVQRLIITVGVLVFATAACFFAGGIFIGANVFGALNRSVESTPDAAARFAQKLAEVSNLPPGDTAWLRFSEQELSSYVRLVLGPSIGLENARARVLDNGQYVVYGRYADLGLPVMMIVEPQTNSAQIIKIVQAAVHVIPIGGQDPGTVSSLGWLPVPGALVQPLVDRALARTGQRYQIISVAPSRPGPDSGTGSQGGLQIQAR